jgi:hypothetical protein
MLCCIRGQSTYKTHLRERRYDQLISRGEDIFLRSYYCFTTGAGDTGDADGVDVGSGTGAADTGDNVGVAVGSGTTTTGAGDTGVSVGATVGLGTTTTGAGDATGACVGLRPQST